MIANPGAGGVEKKTMPRGVLIMVDSWQFQEGYPFVCHSDPLPLYLVAISPLESILSVQYVDNRNDTEVKIFQLTAS